MSMIALVAACLAQAWTSTESDHYVVRTDAGEDLAKRVLPRLERAYEAYATLVPGRPPAEAKFKARLFARREDFDEHVRMRGKPEQGSYYYDHGAREIVAFALPDAPMFERFQHEGFHQYFRSIISEPPQWLNEGMAEYVEAWRPGKDGRLAFALHTGYVRTCREGFRGIDKGALNGQYTLLPLRELMSAPKDAWLKRQKGAYPQSWALVHFFLHGKDAAMRDRFAAYLKALRADASRDDNTREALEKAFDGADFDAMDKAFLEHLDGLVLPGHAAFLEGDRLHTAGKYAEAAAKFTEAIEQLPDHDRYHYFRGMAYYDGAQYEKAEADLLKAVELFPEYSAAWLVLGMTRIERRLFDAARAALDRALELDKRLQERVDAMRKRIAEREK